MQLWKKSAEPSSHGYNSNCNKIRSPDWDSAYKKLTLIIQILTQEAYQNHGLGKYSELIVKQKYNLLSLEYNEVDNDVFWLGILLN